MSSFNDPEVKRVGKFLLALDPTGERTAGVIRRTIDQLYDGQHTGRYRWDQLYKTEKTHCGTLLEINLQREFQFPDGAIMDFRMDGIEVDCKYSQRVGGWMIPPEARGHICIVISAFDNADPGWSLGVVRASSEWLNAGGNRDLKSTFNDSGRAAIDWIWREKKLPSNVLLQLPEKAVSRLMGLRSGNQRIAELFRVAQGMIVRRAVVATVAQQEDYMKRVRANGGARSILRKEGIIILGQYEAHAEIARSLGISVPEKGDSISIRVFPSRSGGPGTANIAGTHWRVAEPNDPTVEAPELPRI